MPPKRIPRGAMQQEKVFYSKEWTKPMDKQFIQELVQQSLLGNFHVGCPNSFALRVAMVSINEEFGTNFDFAYVVGRKNKLYKRYRVFKWMTELSGVYFNPMTNFVDAHPDQWDKMCREKKLACAYMLQGEADFDSLKCIFEEGSGYEDESDDEPKDNPDDEPKGLPQGVPVNETIDVSDDFEIIEISSDHDNDIVQDDDIQIIAGFEDNLDNTDNSFWNELAWYPSDSASEGSIGGSSLAASSNAPPPRPPFNSPSHDNPSSSTTSNSPWKKD